MPSYTFSILQLHHNAESEPFDTYTIEADSEHEAFHLATVRFTQEYPDEDIDGFDILPYQIY